MQHKLLFTGDEIFLDPSSDTVGKGYSIAFEKEVFLETDTSNDCVNYPSSTFQNYRVSFNAVNYVLNIYMFNMKLSTFQSCDDHFLMRAFHSYGWPLPPWLMGYSTLKEKVNVFNRYKMLTAD